jgi:hypothetical protein
MDNRLIFLYWFHTAKSRTQSAKGTPSGATDPAGIRLAMG